MSLSAPGIRQEAVEALRSLIERVTLTPDATALDGVQIELVGDLALILSLASGANADTPPVGGVRSNVVLDDKYRWLRGPATTLICCSAPEEAHDG